MDEDELEIQIANRLWDVARESPDMGNALMDFIGVDLYIRVMELHDN